MIYKPLQFSFFFLFFTLLGCQCNQSKESRVNVSPIKGNEQNKNADFWKNIPAKSTIDTVQIGDVNFDNINDTAFIVTPELKFAINEHGKEEDYYDGCVNDTCFIQVYFSNNLPILSHNQAINGHLINVGDLNKDGFCELLYAPDWFTSCWQGIFVYSIKNGNWSELGNTGVYRCNENVSYKERVKPINDKSFELIGDEWGEDGADLVKTKKRIEFQ